MNETQSTKTFLNSLATDLATPYTALSDDFSLDESNWDSFTIVSVMTNIDIHFGKMLSYRELAACKNIRDLRLLLKLSPAT